MNNVRRWIKPAIQAMKAYQVPASTGMIKLDAMENPYSLPDALKQQWCSELKNVEVNRYPDAQAVLLKKKLREVMAIPEDMGIVLGNGSDELIQIIAMALAQPDRTYIAPEPSFVMYQYIAGIVDVRFAGVPLNNDDFSLDRNTMLDAIEEHQPAVIFLAYPNNPTGNLFDKTIIIDVVRNAPGLVVLDEAYHAYSRESFIPRLDRFENLLVLRTLSKSGLAGLRLGFLAGSPEWLNEFEKIRLPYNINVLSQMTAEFILSHHEVLDAQTQQVCRSRETLFSNLIQIDGIQVWPSSANFILFRPRAQKANDIFAGLRQQGILIKNLHGSHPALSQCLRVTVGTESENTAFITALKQLL
ncbi:MAG: histidinol-phosphate aminotransferase [Gammaproteobacteria bacterium]|nr:histidinol-phosphate aminotransferase [Gammaproteobacteria bacterium]